MFNNFLVFLLLFVIMFVSSYGEYFEECEGKEQTYAEVEDDCTSYIFCHDEDSYSDKCPEESPYFSLEEQTCDTDRKVCKDRPILVDNSYEETTLAEETSSDVSTVYTTNSFFNLFTTATTFPTTALVTSASTTTTPITTTTTQSTTPFKILPSVSTNLPPYNIPSSCPMVDNLQKVIFLPHPKSCSDYFLCYQGKRLPMHCSNMLHFDMRQQKCDYPQNVKCQKVHVASPREQCLSHTIDLYPHPGNCNYYYQCILGYLKVMQCPLHMGWHYEMRACVRRSHAKCYNTIAKSVFN